MTLAATLTVVACLCASGSSVAVGARAASPRPPPNATMQIFDAQEYPHARCLDGSTFGVYLRLAPETASASAKAGWMVVLDGGGLCTQRDDCTARSHTDLGSNTKWAHDIELAAVAYMSPDPRNPFANWNQVFVPYCRYRPCVPEPCRAMCIGPRSRGCPAPPSAIACVSARDFVAPAKPVTPPRRRAAAPPPLPPVRTQRRHALRAAH